MDWRNILFVTSLLTLLALSNAGGDHIKGGSHIKGGAEAVVQEEIVPAPNTFNVKTSNAFGIKTVHAGGVDEVHSPSNPVVGALTKTVLGTPLHPLDAASVPIMTSPVLSNAPMRDPAAYPVVVAQTQKTVATPLETHPAGVKVARRKVIKTIRRKPAAAAQVKTIVPVQEQAPTLVSEDNVQIVLPDSKRVAPAPQPITKTAQPSVKTQVNRPPLITIDGAVNNAGTEVIVLEDGTVVDAKDTSRLLGQTESLHPGGQIHSPGSVQVINQDFKMVRGPQVPSSDVLPYLVDKSLAGLGLSIDAAGVPIVGSPESVQPIVVPGGPGGTSLTLTEAEINNILSSGGFVEFPANSPENIPVVGPVRATQGYATRTNVQTSARAPPAVNILPVERRVTNFNTQTIRVDSGSQRSIVPGRVLSETSINVPGGPAGPSFSLTENEIQNILSSGGIVEFPGETSVNAPGAGAIRATQGGVTTTGSNVQTVSQILPDNKPSALNPLPYNPQRTDFKTQTTSVTSTTRTTGSSPSTGGSIVVPGGPGGASFTLSEDEIEKILSSGGVVEFPSSNTVGIQGVGPIRSSQGSVTTRTNLQSVSQTRPATRPYTENSLPFGQRTDFKTQTATVTSNSRGTEASGGSIVVPGGPGGASLTLTESEIEKILSSGGMVEFPTGTSAGATGAGFFTASQGGITRSNAQTAPQTSSARKPYSGSDLNTIRRNNFRAQVAAVTSSSRGASVPGLQANRGSVIVPGGPGGASFSLTENEIQKILSSGGVVEFPSSTPFGVRETGSRGSLTTTRTNVQAISQVSPARKPIENVRPIDRKRTDFKTQTTVTSSSRGSSVSGLGASGGSVVVPGGPGGASFTLTENEIQNILSSGGVVEFPAGTPQAVSGVRTVSTSQGGTTTTRSNIGAISQPSPARKPLGNVSPVDRTRTDFKTQTTVTSSSRGASVSGLGASGGSVVVPGGPGGASFTLTESEIQKILSSGGFVEFPAGTPQTVSGIRTLTASQRGTDFKTQTTVNSSSRGASVSGLGASGGSVVVPGGPGGASFTLTESEIQKILSSGGVVEFPAGTPQTVPGIRTLTASQRGTTTRSNIGAVSQPSPARKPITNISPAERTRTDFKTQTTVSSDSRGASVSSLGASGGSIVVPGGPGGASFTLTENEIQKILSSGGVVEFPSSTPLGIQGTGISQTSPARKPFTGDIYNINRNTNFRTQTTVTSSSGGATVPGSAANRGSVVVPGGPGGSSFTLTETEIQNILSSGGVVEFPADTPFRSPGAQDSLLKQTKPVSSIQSQSLARPAVRKPASGIGYSSERKRINLNSQTSAITSNDRRTVMPNIPTPGGSVIVTGAPGGASLTLSEDEVHRILSSGGVVEFPVDAPGAFSGGLPLNIQEPSQAYDGLNKQLQATANISPSVRGSQDTNPSIRSGTSLNKLNPGQVHLESVFFEVDTLDQDPAFFKGPDFGQQKFVQVQEPTLVFKEGDIQLQQTAPLANSPVVQALVADSNDKHTQLKLEDSLEQKPVANDPILTKLRVNPLSPEKRLVLDNLSSKYLQEKVPVEISGYAPPPSYLSPFNYRVPHLKSLSVKSPAPIVQEQQRLEQILI